MIEGKIMGMVVAVRSTVGIAAGRWKFGILPIQAKRKIAIAVTDPAPAVVIEKHISEI